MKYTPRLRSGTAHRLRSGTGFSASNLASASLGRTHATAERSRGALTNHGSAPLTNRQGALTNLRGAKKEEPSPLFFSQHAAFAILWFSIRLGGRTAVRPGPRVCAKGFPLRSIEPPSAKTFNLQLSTFNLILQHNRPRIHWHALRIIDHHLIRSSTAPRAKLQ